MRRLAIALTLMLLAATLPAQDAEPAAPSAPTAATDAAAAPSFVQADGSLDLAGAVRYFEDLYRAESSVADAELIVERAGRERRVRMTMWSEGQDKALIIIKAPAREAGTATLKVDNSLWNYLPRIKRTIRIPPSMMLSSWMGSDFTNDDLVRESSYSADYTYALIGRTEEPAGWQIRFTAKEGVIGLWQRFDLWLAADGKTPLRSEWYDRKGELARVLEWSDIKVLGGKTLPARMTLTPTDQDEKSRTVIVYHDISFGVELPSSTFSLSSLERQR